MMACAGREGGDSVHSKEEAADRGNFRYLYSTSFTFGLLALLALPRVWPAPLAPTRVPNHGIFELNLTAAGNYADPYSLMPGDTTSPGFVVGTFTGPSGQRIVIDGFWDGGRNWRIRMAPIALGIWKYTTSSRDSGLGGIQGSFESTPSASRGMIRADPTRPHQFMWSDGTPFLMKAASMSVHGAEQGGGLFSYGGWMSDGSFQKHVDARVSQGFNAMNWGMILSKWGASTQRNEGGQPFGRMNMNNSLNPRYFQAADVRVKYALAKGMIPQFGVVWPDTLPSGWSIRRGKRLWRYVIARYAAYNVTWNLFGEGHEWDSDSLLNDWGTLTKRFDPYRHPTSVHTSNGTGVQGQSWMDYLTLQLFARDNGVDLVRTSRTFNKPIVFAEYLGYDDAAGSGFGAAPDDIRKYHWRYWLSGSFPVYETWMQSCRSADACLNTQAVEYVSKMWSFVESTRWTELNPNQSLVNRGLCLANPGSEYVIYLESGGSVSVNLSAVTGAIRVAWFDPRTGATTDRGMVAGRAKRTFTAPDSNDWVLHIGSRGRRLSSR